MSLFADALADLFADPELTLDATWAAGGVGAPIPVRVIRKRPDRIVNFGGSRALLPTTLIDVRAAEIANPSEGDLVTIEGVPFQILAAPALDSAGLVWTCEAAKL